MLCFAMLYRYVTIERHTIPLQDNSLPRQNIAVEYNALTIQYFTLPSLSNSPPHIAYAVRYPAKQFNAIAEPLVTRLSLPSSTFTRHYISLLYPYNVQHCFT